MKKSKHLRLLATIVAVLMLLSALSGCQTGKKFDSPESMISEMTGTYSGTNDYSGERIIVNEKHIVKFNIGSIFPEIIDESFFWDNFANEDWDKFNIETLLSKTFVDVTIEPVAIDVKKSTISGLWVDKNGRLFSQSKGGYPFNKRSSESDYPTTEMQEKFAEYLKYLQEYEKSIIIAEAESDLSQKQESLKSTLSSATSSSRYKSLASAETIAECAFDLVKEDLKYPRTASLYSYSISPQYDSYGRVCTGISVTHQNGYGNYITQDYYVVLQSCSTSGHYTYTPGMYYVKNGYNLNLLFLMNDWDEDPNADDAKEGTYNEAIQLIKNKEYRLAANKLGTLGDYKSSVKLKEACFNFFVAEKYKNAIDLFAEGKYAEASKALSAMLKDYYSAGYLNAERVIELCNAAISNTAGNNNNASGDGNTSQPPTTEPLTTEPPATQPPATDPPACTHDFTDATCTNPKTCTRCGETTGTALGHNYSAATCTKAQTCSVCGATTGTTVDHNWQYTTCTTEEVCSVCGAEGMFSVPGHKWVSATCTEAEYCTVCQETGAEAHGHWMVFTKCRRSSCDYIDYSCIAGTYTNIDGYGVPVGTTTTVDIDATNVSVSNSGELSFTYNGENYTLTLKQNNKSDNFTAFFDCYLNGVLVEDVVFRAGNEMYDNRIYLDGFVVDGCRIYLYATK